MKRGQIALFLLFALVTLVVLALLNVDMFLSVRVKDKLQNGGDAAAIAAARKQGLLLNEIGRLNIEHLLAASRNDTNECRRIVDEQRRLALLGPVDALMLADKAARMNGLKPEKDFSRILEDHVKDIRLIYAAAKDKGEAYPEPWAGAWTEYATRIEEVISGGIAAGPDNMEFYDAAAGHLLLLKQFYFAISARDWCWFYFRCMGELQNYDSYRDWAPLPLARENSFDNSEIFSLHVEARRTAATSVFTLDEIDWLLEHYLGEKLPERGLFEGSFTLLDDPEDVWFFFDNYAWRRWFDGKALAGDEYHVDFPIAGEIKPEYNIRGCAAICRTVASTKPVAVGGEYEYTWSAAAKPFGTAFSPDGETGNILSAKRLVVPEFSDVRLVPLDSVGGENLSTADYSWVTHLREHLGIYLLHGPSRLGGGCFWCLQLKTWESSGFHLQGVNWLKYNSGSCRIGGGGGGGHGGTVHGH